MIWGQRLASVVWLGIGLAIAYGSRELGVGSLNNPGPGLFPFIIGIGMAALSISVAVTEMRTAPSVPPAPAAPAPDGAAAGGMFPVIAVIAALVFYAFTLERLGVLLCTGLFLSVLFAALGRKNIFVSIGAAVAITCGSYLAFAKLLKITLPIGPFGF
jgi:putative tricarboxylic transport membrane protein